MPPAAASVLRSRENSYTRTTTLGATPSVVADRVSNCLVNASLDSWFNDERAEAFVKTADHVEFYVRLFQGTEIGEGGIIVEIQKKRGCTMRFRRTARLVLLSAKGTTTASSPAQNARRSTRNFRPLLPKNRTILSSGVGDGSQHITSVVENALEHAFTLLKKDRLDAKELGMESLVLLTDEECSGVDKALLASKAILGDGSRWGTEFVATLAETAKNDRPSHSSSEQQQRHREVMRRRTLAAAANSLTALQGSDPGLCASLCEDGWVGREETLAALVEDVRDAEARPYDAREATRCLNVILGASDVPRRRALDLGLLTSAATLSRAVGRCQNPRLGEEADRLLSLLEQSNAPKTRA